MKNTEQNLLLVFVVNIAILFAVPALADNGYILKKGKEYPICREMIEILNLPDNAHSISYRAVGNELTIPKKYKNFQTVEWNSLQENELSNYITPEDKQALESIKKFALTKEKDWDGKGDFIFEITQVDFDRDGKALETLLRYRLPSWKQWNCMLASNEPEQYRKMFNTSYQRCTLFKYGGNIYKAGNFGASALIVDKPFAVKFDKKSKEGYDLGFETICDIENPNWQRELKGKQK